MGFLSILQKIGLVAKKSSPVVAILAGEKAGEVTKLAGTVATEVTATEATIKESPTQPAVRKRSPKKTVRKRARN